MRGYEFEKKNNVTARYGIILITARSWKLITKISMLIQG